MKRSFLLVFLLTTGILLYAQDGLVSYWNFDLLVNNKFYDEGPLKNHGSVDGPYLVDGVKGKALYFDGKKSFAVVGEPDTEPDTAYKNLGQGSISLWFRVDTIPLLHGIAPIFYYGNKEACDYFDAANEGLIIEVGHSPVQYLSKRLYFTIWKNGCTLPSFCYDSNTSITEGKWYHFVAVVGENYNTGYLNGEEMIYRRYNFGNNNYSQFFEDAPNPEQMWLGKGHWDRTEQYLEGAIDELRIYSRPLSAAEIRELYADSDSVISNNGSWVNEYNSSMIYPNPAGEVVRYDLNSTGMKFTRIELFDTNGKLIMHKPVHASTGSLNTAHLKPGIYNLRFYGDQGVKHQLLIVSPRY